MVEHNEVEVAAAEEDEAVFDFAIDPTVLDMEIELHHLLMTTQ